MYQSRGSVSTGASAASEEKRTAAKDFSPAPRSRRDREGATLLCVHARRFLPGGKRERRTDERLTEGRGETDGRITGRRASASREGGKDGRTDERECGALDGKLPAGKSNFCALLLAQMHFLSLRRRPRRPSVRLALCPFKMQSLDTRQRRRDAAVRALQ